MALFFQLELKIAVHAVLKKNRISEVKNFFDTFLRRVIFILNVGKPFSSNIEG